MRVDLFDFDLPEDRIATRPVKPRDAARLLVVGGPEAPLQDRVVRDLPGLLRPGDTLVLNDTRVIPARLVGTRRRGEASARIEAMLHKREATDRWRAFVRPAKRLAVGDTIRFGEETEGACLLSGLDATVTEKGDGGEVVLRFALSGPILDESIASLGHMPLPPYIASKRPEDAADRVDYQTVYAAEEGAVAAPTAGLHFTDELITRLSERGIDRQFVTLHVGAGTFLPVKADDTSEHRMHAEWGSVSAETAAALNATRQRGGRIVAVGTTSLRLLESATTPEGEVRPWAGDTAIFITPGYRFRAVDVLMTNFHLPRSTLFMLVSAFAGLGEMQRAYAHAIANGYRFYSYGDASLLFRAEMPR
ncbi:tRNA preQ1(34) S-adenosylmethionine ribosyltransferase-isomerase QueA [Chelatococcus asaccharovorans]|uniref:tRNA preQ1(34) S-adenosylmethionine ribosyltransferase-isomerase QueA n=1 Tax=Chelatococcus asaccharovorans TaxID=28210 RepID=UPI00224C70D1|nr:tRNA preQ1(34) S-adenosylmethionine ribosyltransferase-isomerase QueA [Chelatococcus asaccharovorans]CAH1667564.1 tRNA preQ1(34) S-adenosylmethionine ribosyltransferase-isomerase [Chelatococcus asaccharovorans]CAH1680868.1 tRNA preQ1(34) S-adenosylmethionine ribosyltransferase-isomerase [Chelatococcus asaccharovorans]